MPKKSASSPKFLCDCLYMEMKTGEGAEKQNITSDQGDKLKLERTKKKNQTENRRGRKEPTSKLFSSQFSAARVREISFNHTQRKPATWLSGTPSSVLLRLPRVSLRCA